MMYRENCAPDRAGIIVVADISALNLACLVAGEDYPLYITETANASLRRERVGAYIALKEAYGSLFSSGMPEILRGELGKPYFLGTNVAFNYSHIDGAVAIGFMPYDGEKLDTPPEIGVDIEWIIDEARALRIEKGYIKGIDFTALNYLQDEISIRIARLSERGELIWCDEEGADFSKEELEPLDLFGLDNLSKGEEITARWTILESALKATGGGFRDLAHTSEIFPRTSVMTAKGWLEGKQYIVSLARYN